MTTEAAPLAGLVDLHAHVLPGVDDGPVNESEALHLLGLLEAEGVATVAATPHVKTGFFWPPDRAALAERTAALQALAAVARLKLEVVTGGEVFLDPDLLRTEWEGHLPTLNGTSYLLVELPHTTVPAWAHEVLWRLRRKGYRPLLAHPELNRAFRDDRNLPLDLVRQGVLLQVGAASLLGRWGAEPAAYGLELIRAGLTAVVASDTHSERRPPELQAAAGLVGRKVGQNVARSLCQETPAAIVADEELRAGRGATGFVQLG